MYDWAQQRKEVDGDAAARRLRALTRIRKLLRLAEDQAGKPEGESARERALVLMKTYGLHQSAVELGEGADYKQRTFALGASAPWRRTLVHAIADYFDCVALYEKDADEAQTFGPEHALPQLEYTYSVYLGQLRRAWKAHTQELIALELWSALNKAQQLDARDSFCVSFVLGVKQRLELDRREEREADPASWEAALRQRKDLDRWMRRGGVRWRANPSGVGALSSEGYKAGLEAEVRAGVDGRRGPAAITMGRDGGGG